MEACPIKGDRKQNQGVMGRLTLNFPIKQNPQMCLEITLIELLQNVEFLSTNPTRHPSYPTRTFLVTGSTLISEEAYFEAVTC